MEKYFTKYFVENFDINEYFYAGSFKEISQYYTHKKPNKAEQLVKFISYWKGIKQKDAEWYKFMGKTVGGSEMGAILGKNPYSSREKVINDKVLILFGENNFNGGPACYWGSLFEDVLGMYIEEKFDTKIYGDNICMQVYDSHRNSPDGYMVVNTYQTDALIKDRSGYLKNDVFYKNFGIYTKNSDSIPTNEMVVLLEFKCPYSTRKVGPVPIYYELQVQSGLSVSPIAEMGLFVDAAFRRCKLNDIHTDNYESNQYRDRAKLTNPKACGLIGIFDPKNTVKCFTDFGGADLAVFEEMLLKIKNNEYTVQYLRPNILENNWDSIDFIGVLPWKLFDISYTLIERENDFMDRVYPVIAGVIEEVNEKYAIEKARRDADLLKINGIQDKVDELTEENILHTIKASLEGL
jgi:hypothetical protein